MRRLAVFLFLTLAIAACGYKGDVGYTDDAGRQVIVDTANAILI